jgi:hypothetical protein
MYRNRHGKAYTTSDMPKKGKIQARLRKKSAGGKEIKLLSISRKDKEQEKTYK